MRTIMYYAVCVHTNIRVVHYCTITIHTYVVYSIRVRMGKTWATYLGRVTIGYLRPCQITMRHVYKNVGLTRGNLGSTFPFKKVGGTFFHFWTTITFTYILKIYQRRYILTLHIKSFPWICYMLYFFTSFFYFCRSFYAFTCSHIRLQLLYLLKAQYFGLNKLLLCFIDLF